MIRISVRGVGLAAAALAATSLTAVGFNVPADASPNRVSASNTITNVSPVETGLTDSAERQSLRSTRVAVAARQLLIAQTAKAAAANRAAAAHLAQVKNQARAAQARRAAAARTNRSTTRVVYSGSVLALGQQLAAARGWTGAQFSCLVTMWNHESGWRATAYNPNGGAYGIPQAQPGNKMASAGSDWRTNPATQIRWGLSYIGSTYGSPCAAWSFWQDHHWY